MRILSTLLITAAALALSGTAQAQTRDGLFIGVGAGWGSAKYSDADSDGDSRQGSLTVNVRVGTVLSERLLVGAELNGWFDSQDDVSVSLFNTTAALYYYPADSGLFVKGGLGLSRADIDEGEASFAGIGLGLMAGLGYDVPIGESTAVTPMATFWYGRPGDLKFEGIEVVRGAKHNVVELGVAVTFY